MTISTESRKAGPYIGDGAQTQFPFAFKVFKEADIRVVVADTSTGHERELVLGRDYKVYLQTNQNTVPGGNVALSAPLDHSCKLVLLSRVPYLQPVEITNQGAFYPSVINNGLDRATIQIQQLAEIQARTLTYPATITGFNPQLPPPEPDKALGYNDDCSGFKNIDIAGMKDANAQALATSNKAASDAQAAIQKANEAVGVAKGIEAKADQAISQSQSAINQIATAIEKTDHAITAVDDLKSEFNQIVANNHATTADRLKTPRHINGVLFDGSADINVTPPGAVQLFAQPWAPVGWLKANGAEVSRTTYANLFAAIGTHYGDGNGSTTFNLPDLRGEFLRSWDDGRGVDKDRWFGGWQDGDNKAHQHYGTTGLAGAHHHSGVTEASGYHTHPVGRTGGGNGSHAAESVPGTGGELHGGGIHQHNFGTDWVGDHSHNFTTSFQGSEARPRNIALLACIKI